MIKDIHGGDIYRHKNVLDFSSNMNPLGTPRSVVKAASEGCAAIANYPDIHKSELRQALSSYEGVPEDWLIFGNGAAELIFLLALAEKPQRALITAPTFAEYEQALKTTGCDVRYFYLKEENGFRVTEEILDSITDEIDMIFLCNPNNPTGLTIAPDLLDRVIRKCAICRIRLVLDECFQDFLDQESIHTRKHMLGSCHHIFILRAFTKRYAMAGIRLGYGICADHLFLERMQELIQPWNVSIPAQMAGVAALDENDYVSAARQIVSEERDFLKKALIEAGFQVFDSEANYIFFKGPAGLADHTLQAGVMIRDCSNYVGLSEGFYRVAVRTHDENVQLLRALTYGGE